VSLVLNKFHVKTDKGDEIFSATGKLQLR